MYTTDQRVSKCAWFHPHDRKNNNFKWNSFSPIFGARIKYDKLSPIINMTKIFRNASNIIWRSGDLSWMHIFLNSESADLSVMHTVQIVNQMLTILYLNQTIIVNEQKSYLSNELICFEPAFSQLFAFCLMFLKVLLFPFIHFLVFLDL